MQARIRKIINDIFGLKKKAARKESIKPISRDLEPLPGKGAEITAQGPNSL